MALSLTLSQIYLCFHLVSYWVVHFLIEGLFIES